MSHSATIDVVKSINISLSNLSNSILTKSPEKQQILSEWLTLWSTYLRHEDTFNPCFLIPYKRGMIVHAHFGFNVGSEIGGARYAVVVENNNNPASSNVVVVPISSLSPEQTPETLHPSEVYLGCVIPGSDKESYATVLQIRPISKMRIIRPKKKEHGIIRLPADKLDEIDNKIIQYFTKTC